MKFMIGSPIWIILTTCLTYLGATPTASLALQPLPSHANSFAKIAQVLRSQGTLFHLLVTDETIQLQAQAEPPETPQETPDQTPDSESPTSDSPAPSSRDSTFMWLLVGVGVVGVVFISGLFYILRVPSVAPSSEEEDKILEEDKSPQSFASQLNDRESESVPLEQTTRLAKVDIIEELIQDLRKPDRKQRSKAIWELAQRADSRAVQPLVDCIMNADSQEQGLILEALSQIGTRTLKPMNQALALSLQDENPEVRKNAIRDLTRMYELFSSMGQLLAHAADDPDAEVKETAQWALQQLDQIKTPGDLNRLSQGEQS